MAVDGDGGDAGAARTRDEGAGAEGGKLGGGGHADTVGRPACASVKGSQRVPKVVGPSPLPGSTHGATSRGGHRCGDDLQAAALLLMSVAVPASTPRSRANGRQRRRGL